MKTRELLRLLKAPNGSSFLATDRINNYRYTILVYETSKEFAEEYGINMGSWLDIKVSGSGPFAPSLSLHPEERVTTPDDFWDSRNYIKYSYTVLTGNMKVGGLYMSSDNVSAIYDLVLLPRGSYKEFEKRIKELEKVTNE